MPGSPLDTKKDERRIGWLLDKVAENKSSREDLANSVKEKIGDTKNWFIKNIKKVFSKENISDTASIGSRHSDATTKSSASSPADNNDPKVNLVANNIGRHFSKLFSKMDVVIAVKPELQSFYLDKNKNSSATEEYHFKVDVGFGGKNEKGNFEKHITFFVPAKLCITKKLVALSEKELDSLIGQEVHKNKSELSLLREQIIADSRKIEITVKNYNSSYGMGAGANDVPLDMQKLTQLKDEDIHKLQKYIVNMEVYRRRFKSYTDAITDPITKSKDFDSHKKVFDDYKSAGEPFKDLNPEAKGEALRKKNPETIRFALACREYRNSKIPIDIKDYLDFKHTFEEHCLKNIGEVKKILNYESKKSLGNDSATEYRIESAQGDYINIYFEDPYLTLLDPSLLSLDDVSKPEAKKELFMILCKNLLPKEGKKFGFKLIDKANVTFLNEYALKNGLRMSDDFEAESDLTMQIIRLIYYINLDNNDKYKLPLALIGAENSFEKCRKIYTSYLGVNNKKVELIGEERNPKAHKIALSEINKFLGSRVVTKISSLEILLPDNIELNCDNIKVNESDSIFYTFRFKIKNTEKLDNVLLKGDRVKVTFPDLQISKEVVFKSFKVDLLELFSKFEARISVRQQEVTLLHFLNNSSEAFSEQRASFLKAYQIEKLIKDRNGSFSLEELDSVISILNKSPCSIPFVRLNGLEVSADQMNLLISCIEDKNVSKANLSGLVISEKFNLLNLFKCEFKTLDELIQKLETDGFYNEVVFYDGYELPLTLFQGQNLHQSSLGKIKEKLSVSKKITGADILGDLKKLQVEINKSEEYQNSFEGRANAARGNPSLAKKRVSFAPFVNAIRQLPEGQGFGSNREPVTQSNKTNKPTRTDKSRVDSDQKEINDPLYSLSNALKFEKEKNNVNLERADKLLVAIQLLVEKEYYAESDLLSKIYEALKGYSNASVCQPSEKLVNDYIEEIKITCRSPKRLSKDVVKKLQEVLIKFANNFNSKERTSLDINDFSEYVDKRIALVKKSYNGNLKKYVDAFNEGDFNEVILQELKSTIDKEFINRDEKYFISLDRYNEIFGKLPMQFNQIARQCDENDKNLFKLFDAIRRYGFEFDIVDNMEIKKGKITEAYNALFYPDKSQANSSNHAAPHSFFQKPFVEKSSPPVINFLDDSSSDIPIADDINRKLGGYLEKQDVGSDYHQYIEIDELSNTEFNLGNIKNTFDIFKTTKLGFYSVAQLISLSKKLEQFNNPPQELSVLKQKIALAMVWHLEYVKFTGTSTDDIYQSKIPVVYGLGRNSIENQLQIKVVDGEELTRGEYLVGYARKHLKDNETLSNKLPRRLPADEIGKEKISVEKDQVSTSRFSWGVIPGKRKWYQKVLDTLSVNYSQRNYRVKIKEKFDEIIGTLNTEVYKGYFSGKKNNLSKKVGELKDFLKDSLVTGWTNERVKTNLLIKEYEEKVKDFEVILKSSTVNEDRNSFDENTRRATDSVSNYLVINAYIESFKNNSVTDNMLHRLKQCKLTDNQKEYLERNLPSPEDNSIGFFKKIIRDHVLSDSNSDSFIKLTTQEFLRKNWDNEKELSKFVKDENNISYLEKFKNNGELTVVEQIKRRIEEFEKISDEEGLTRIEILKEESSDFNKILKEHKKEYQNFFSSNMSKICELLLTYRNANVINDRLKIAPILLMRLSSLDKFFDGCEYFDQSVKDDVKNSLAKISSDKSDMTAQIAELLSKMMANIQDKGKYDSLQKDLSNKVSNLRKMVEKQNDVNNQYEQLVKDDGWYRLDNLSSFLNLDTALLDCLSSEKRKAVTDRVAQLKEIKAEYDELAGFTDLSQLSVNDLQARLARLEKFKVGSENANLLKCEVPDCCESVDSLIKQCQKELDSSRNSDNSSDTRGSNASSIATAVARNNDARRTLPSTAINPSAFGVFSKINLKIKGVKVILNPSNKDEAPKTKK